MRLPGAGIHEPTAVALDPTNPEVIYAGAQDGLAKSTDGGLSWRFLSADLSYPRKILVDPIEPWVLYACRRALPYEDGSAAPGIYKSTDGGASWQVKGEGTAGEYVYNLALDPRTPQVIYAGGREGLVFKSTDAGETWATAGERPALAGESPRTVVGLVVYPLTGDLYAVEDTFGTFRSTNGGQTWTTVHRSSGYLLVDAGANTLYLAGHNLWKSADGGASWLDISGNMPRDPRKWSLQLTWAGVYNPQVLYIQQQYQSTYRSTDGGVTWILLEVGERFIPCAIKSGPQPELYGAAAGTLARYVDGDVP
jgi:photosystem II stability/assembly factor-like uncharacterized protein